MTRAKRSRGAAALAACLGFAVLLTSCFGGSADAFVITAVPTPEPVYEPAGSEGDNAFFRLEDQIAATNSARIGLVLAEAETAGVDPVSAIAQISLTSPTEEELKSGLYGGSEDATCDPERLIRHLLDNPTQGQVWAEVQGIGFADIPDFIRSLTPEVLAEDTTVLNHGFDPKGHAIPIVSTLQAGTAVMVDENGDVRVRCYCGNPILPFDAEAYEPPVCLVQLALVYTSPEDRRRIDDVPRRVNATNRVGTFEGVQWAEVTWADQTGWVRADEARERYCRPQDKFDCVSFAQITQEPGSGNYVGEINNGYVSVVVQNLEGWSLIKFAETSGWIEASSMGGGNCDAEAACITVPSGTYGRPGFAGGELLGANQAQNVEFTGESFIDETGTYQQVVVTSPGPTQVGYVLQSDVSPLPDENCTISIRCSTFDVDAPVYADSTNEEVLGAAWFAQVQVGEQPQDGRYEVSWGDSTAWIDVFHLLGVGCEQTVSCIQARGAGFYPLPPEGDERALSAAPFLATFTGKIAVAGDATYREVAPAASADGFWIEASTGYASLDPSACDSAAPCNPATQICEVECVVHQVANGYSANVFWEAEDRQADLTVSWPSGLAGTEPSALGPKISGASTIATGIVSFDEVVSVTWADRLEGLSGTADCALNPCDFADESGVDPQACLAVECQIDRAIGPAGQATDAVTIRWSPDSAVLDLIVDWPFQPALRLIHTTSPTRASAMAGPGGLEIHWRGPDGQVGTTACGETEDVIDCETFDLALVSAETAVCCPDGTVFSDGACTAIIVATPTTTPTPTPNPEPTVLPTAAPQPTSEPLATTVPQPTAVPTAEPQLTPTPEVECEDGRHSSGECLVLCFPGDPNPRGLCVCAPGSQLLPDANDGCGVSCPAGDVQADVATCARCPDGTQVVDGVCSAFACGANERVQGNECVGLTCPTGFEGPTADNWCDRRFAATQTPPQYSCAAGQLEGTNCRIANSGVFVPGNFVPGIPAVDPVPPVPGTCPQHPGLGLDSNGVTCSSSWGGQPVGVFESLSSQFECTLHSVEAGEHNFTCVTSAVGALPGIPGSAAVSATCSGVPTNQPATQCGTTEAVPDTVVAATEVTQPPTCPANTTLLPPSECLERVRPS